MGESTDKGKENTGAVTEEIEGTSPPADSDVPAEATKKPWIRLMPESPREWMRIVYILGGFASVIGGLLAYFAIVVVPMPGKSYDGVGELTATDRERAERLEAVVTQLSEVFGPRNYVEREALYRARDYIRAELESYGYTTRLETFEVSGVEVSNVICERTGSELPDEIIIVGAHYDTAETTAGANDNGSGVAAMLEMAAAFSEVGEYVPGRTIRFVAFTNEEPPFFDTDEMGSAVHAARADDAGDDIVGVFALETMGYYSTLPDSQEYPPPFDIFYPDTGDFVAFVGNVKSRRFVRWSVGAFRENARVGSEGVAAPGRISGIYWSDHHPFWDYGIPAIMVTDTAIFRDPNYHRWSDRPGNLNYDVLALVVDGLIDVVDQLADPATERIPNWNE